MKQHILPGIRLTIICIALFMVIYPALVWVIAQAAPAKGEGETIAVNGKVVGYKLEGQNFTQDKYFWGRPSAAGYSASAGSNKGPSNPDYLKDIQSRIDTFLVHNPGIKKEEIPSDIVTASGSGLDPDISLQAANIQVKRIATSRNIAPEKIQMLIKNNTQEFINGIKKINVLKINIDLDKLK